MSTEKLLFLNKKDMFALVNPNDIMDCIEECLTLYKSGKFCMPNRLNATYLNKTVVDMPAFTPECMGTKLLTVFPENIDLKLPSIHGLMIINDFKTGKPLAVMDGSCLTAIRTGAVGGVGVRHLAKKDVTKLGVVGCGVQGYYQTFYSCFAREIKEIYLYNYPVIDLSDFISRLKADLKKYGIEREIEFHVCSSGDEVVEKSEVVIAATTSKQPLFQNRKELFADKCFIGIGSYQPVMREFPDGLFENDIGVYVEMEYAMEETGDLIDPIASGKLKKENVKLFAEVIEKGAEPHQTLFFKSVGMALYDVVVGNKLYNEGISKKLGQMVDF
ncbi:Ornithine cyclodeaminase [Entamoeba marina]